jgi:hypothetical protein
VTHDWLEIALHEPLLDQVWLRERAPNLFQRMRDLTLDNYEACFGGGLTPALTCRHLPA